MNKDIRIGEIFHQNCIFDDMIAEPFFFNHYTFLRPIYSYYNPSRDQTAYQLTIDFWNTFSIMYLRRSLFGDLSSIIDLDLIESVIIQNLTVTRKVESDFLSALHKLTSIKIYNTKMPIDVLELVQGRSLERCFVSDNIFVD